MRVVPMHPLEGGELDVLETTPGPASTDHLGLVEADDGFSQSVIVGVASAADGRLNARLGEPLDVTRRTARRDRCDAPMDVLSLVGARKAGSID